MLSGTTSFVIVFCVVVVVLVVVCKVEVGVAFTAIVGFLITLLFGVLVVAGFAVLRTPSTTDSFGMLLCALCDFADTSSSHFSNLRWRQVEGWRMRTTGKLREKEPRPIT